LNPDKTPCQSIFSVTADGSGEIQPSTIGRQARWQKPRMSMAGIRGAILRYSLHANFANSRLPIFQEWDWKIAKVGSFD
jgi:hypothetical protein